MLPVPWDLTQSLQVLPPRLIGRKIVTGRIGIRIAVLQRRHRGAQYGSGLCATEKFDEAWYPGEAVGTVVFVEQAGKTTVTQTIRYDSRETRDGVLKSPMESGVAASYDRLEALLASPEQKGKAS